MLRMSLGNWKNIRNIRFLPNLILKIIIVFTEIFAFFLIFIQNPPRMHVFTQIICFKYVSVDMSQFMDKTSGLIFFIRIKLCSRVISQFLLIKDCYLFTSTLLPPSCFFFFLAVVAFLSIVPLISVLSYLCSSGYLFVAPWIIIALELNPQLYSCKAGVLPRRHISWT